MTTTIGVAQLRQHASEWLRRVERGETFTITSNGRPVATLGPVTEPPRGLEALRAAGLISEPEGDFHAWLAENPPTAGPPLTPRVLELRDEERY